MATTTTSAPARKLTLAEVIASAAKDGLVTEEMRTIKEGDLIEGVYLGAGPDMDFENKATGEVKSVGTHRFKLGDGLIIRLLGSYQMDKTIPEYLPGAKFKIFHNGEVKTRGGGRVNDIKIFADETMRRPTIAADAPPVVAP